MMMFAHSMPSPSGAAADDDEDHLNESNCVYSPYTPRSYVKGWTPSRDFIEYYCPTIMDTGEGSANRLPDMVSAIGDGRAGNVTGGHKTVATIYKALVAECIEKKLLWEDPHFPAINGSLYKKNPLIIQSIEWKRPHVSFSLISALVYE